MDVLDLLLVAFLLVAGIIGVILGARMLLRGDAVTAEEAVKWRRAVRKSSRPGWTTGTSPITCSYLSALYLP